MSIALDLGFSSGSGVFASLQEYAKQDWYAVLGSGAATAIKVDSEGAVVGLIDMHQLMSASVIDSNALYPDAFRYLGRWAEEGDDRVALSLTRTRELVIQAGGFVRYIYRSGRWRSLPLDNAVGMGWLKVRESPLT